MGNIVQIFVKDNGGIETSDKETLYVNPSRLVSCAVRLEIDDMMGMYFIYFSNNGEYSSAALGGSGHYEYSINDGVDWFGPSWYAPIGPGTYYCKVRDKYEPSNVANALPYPITY